MWGVWGSPFRQTVHSGQPLDWVAPPLSRVRLGYWKVVERGVPWGIQEEQGVPWGVQEEQGVPWGVQEEQGGQKDLWVVVQMKTTL